MYIVHIVFTYHRVRETLHCQALFQSRRLYVSISIDLYLYSICICIQFVFVFLKIVFVFVKSDAGGGLSCLLCSHLRGVPIELSALKIVLLLAGQYLYLYLSNCTRSQTKLTPVRCCNWTHCLVSGIWICQKQTQKKIKNCTDKMFSLKIAQRLNVLHREKEK